jgi:hypothetical protein
MLSLPDEPTDRIRAHRRLSSIRSAQAPPPHSYSTQPRAVLDGRSSPETATISPCRPNFEFKNSAMNSGNTPWCSSAPSAATNVTPIRTHLASSAGGTVAWMTSSSGCVVQDVAKRIARGALLRHTNPADIRHCRDDPPYVLVASNRVCGPKTQFDKFPRQYREPDRLRPFQGAQAIGRVLEARSC